MHCRVVRLACTGLLSGEVESRMYADAVVPFIACTIQGRLCSLGWQLGDSLRSRLLKFYYAIRALCAS
jgi:hypothetical protein